MTTEETKRTIFDCVKDKTNWKNAIKAINCGSVDEAQTVMDAIIWFVGGAEMSPKKDGTYSVTSKGYYHYIGA